MPVPRPVAAAGSAPVNAAISAAEAVVLAIPMSPATRHRTPLAIRSRATSVPASTAATASARVIAGAVDRSAVPRRTLRSIKPGNAGSSVATPTSTTTTRAPTWAAKAFTPAPPARKFATICPVTSCGQGLTPWACTPWSAAKTATPVGSGIGGGQVPASPASWTETSSSTPSEPRGLVSQSWRCRASAIAAVFSGRISAVRASIRAASSVIRFLLPLWTVPLWTVPLWTVPLWTVRGKTPRLPGHWCRGPGRRAGASPNPGRGRCRRAARRRPGSAAEPGHLGRPAHAAAGTRLSVAAQRGRRAARPTGRRATLGARPGRPPQPPPRRPPLGCCTPARRPEPTTTPTTGAARRPTGLPGWALSAGSRRAARRAPRSWSGCGRRPARAGRRPQPDQDLGARRAARRLPADSARPGSPVGRRAAPVVGVVAGSGRRAGVQQPRGGRRGGGCGGRPGRAPRVARRPVGRAARRPRWAATGGLVPAAACVGRPRCPGSAADPGRRRAALRHVPRPGFGLAPARCPGPRHQCPGSRGVFPRTVHNGTVHNGTVHNGRRNLMTDDTARIDALTAEIRPLNTAAMADARHRQDRLTKPRGSLGVLEDVSVQLAGLAGTCPPPMPEPTGVAVFAADHGVHAQGVSPWPQEVTGQMVANFLAGGAGVNAFAAQVGARVVVVDVGVATELPALPGLMERNVRRGTADLSTAPAMTRAEAVAAVLAGADVARDLVASGVRCLVAGDMGITNTTASAALIAAFTGADPAAAAERVPLILDGVIVGAAALAAVALAPDAVGACLAGHRSAEPGHTIALQHLGLRPLVDLELRLGEGTGAVLAVPLVQCAVRALRDMATFDSAGVVDKEG